MFERKQVGWHEKRLQKIVRLLYQTAQVAGRVRNTRKTGVPRRVVHISPSYFSESSVIGGGERYVMSLAAEMATQIDTVFVTFGDARRSLTQGQLRIEVYPVLELLNGVIFDPLSYSFLVQLLSADVIHCHQYRTVVTNLAILGGAILRKRVFVTDYGGQGVHFTESLPLSSFVTCFLPISRFSAKTFPEFRNTEVIYGGVSPEFLANGTAAKSKKVVYVGRIMPHKGINYLIEALDEQVELEIIGRVYDQDYYSFLRELAGQKKVKFLTEASDQNIIDAYRTAIATVLPSVYQDFRGTRHPLPELLGLVLLESMACGTPAICTDVGGMPEIIDDGVTGFVVPPNDPESLRNKIHWLLRHPSDTYEMGRRARETVLKNFTWTAVVHRCLNAYTDQR